MKGWVNTSRLRSHRRSEDASSQSSKICVFVNRDAGTKQQSPQTHTPADYWTVYCSGARSRHVRRHAAPLAEQTLLRDEKMSAGSEGFPSAGMGSRPRGPSRLRRLMRANLSNSVPRWRRGVTQWSGSERHLCRTSKASALRADATSV